MTLFLSAFVVFCLVLAGMAVGVIFSNRRITGSCGGLANMRTKDGESMCECGSRPGQTCSKDPERRCEAAHPFTPVRADARVRETATA